MHFIKLVIIYLYPNSCKIFWRTLYRQSQVVKYSSAIHYFDLGRGAKYCDERVCVSVCLSVHEHVSNTSCPNLPECSLLVACSRGSKLLRGQCYGLPALMWMAFFSYNGAALATTIGHMLKVTHQKAAPG